MGYSEKRGNHLFGFKEFANAELITGWDVIFKTEVAEPLHFIDEKLVPKEPENEDWIADADDAVLGAIFGPVCAVSEFEDDQIAPITEPLDSWTMSELPFPLPTGKKGAEEIKDAADMESLYEFESVSGPVLFKSVFESVSPTLESVLSALEASLDVPMTIINEMNPEFDYLAIAIMNTNNQDDMDTKKKC